MPEPSQNRIIRIPADYTASQREAIAERVLSKIRRRTREGLDVNNRPFAGYSPNYEKSGESVDLRQSGDMVADLELVSHGPGFITIGFDSEESNDKAAYVQAPRGVKAGRQPRREFVGISQTDLNTILEDFPLDF